MSSHAYGEPLSIINFNDSVRLDFDRAKLDGLLLHPEVKDRKVVLISIVGAFRKGKSFFLDYCLRYMYGNVSLLYVAILMSQFINLQLLSVQVN